MFVRLLPFALSCILTTASTTECVTQSATKNTPQKKFNSCAPKNSSIKVAANTPAPKPIEKKKTQRAVTSRTVTVKNEITRDQLGYKKFGWHYPDKEFKILIDGKELKEHATTKTIIKNDVLPVVFHYDFGYNYRGRGKGKRRCTFKIPPTHTEVVLAFNWKTDSQVLIDNIDDAVFIKQEELT